MALTSWVRGRYTAASSRVPESSRAPESSEAGGSSRWAGFSRAAGSSRAAACAPKLADPSSDVLATAEFEVRSAAELRSRWADASRDCGWAFPSDWHAPAVDAVVDALTSSRDVWPAAERLGGERAVAGVSLGETLADIDVLTDLLPAHHREVLVRAVSLGWGDRAAAPAAAVSDALTGLASAEYLRIRLGEIYRAAEVEGSSAARTHALVVVRVGEPGPRPWAHGLPMILVGDALRTVFDADQSLARIGQSVAVALAPRDANLARRARLMAELIAARVGVSDDADLLPQVWIERLPPTWQAATALVAELAR
jgi:hypothetical protein